MSLDIDVHDAHKLEGFSRDETNKRTASSKNATAHRASPSSRVQEQGGQHWTNDAKRL